jgi:hypothetical protein
VARGLASPRAEVEALRAASAAERGRFVVAVVDHAGDGLAFSAVHSRLLDPILAEGVALDDDALARVVRAFARGAGYPGRSMNYDFAGKALVGVVEAREATWSLPLASATSKWARVLRDGALSERLRQRLAGQHPVTTVPVSLADAWGQGVEHWSVGLAEPDRHRWAALFAVAAQATRTTPSGAWDKRARALLEGEDRAALTQQLVAHLDAVDLHVVRMQSGVSVWYGLAEHNTSVVRGLVWLARFLDGDQVAACLARIASAGFRKIPGVGAANSALGRAAVFSLGELPAKRGVLALSRLRGTVKYAAATKAIDAALEHAARQVGQTVADAVETGVPDHGLDATGRRHVAVGEVVAILRVDGERAVLEWQSPRRKTPQKSVPKGLARTHADEVTQLRKDRKALQAMLVAQPGRLEALYASGRALPLAAFRERYLEHPVVGTFARRLLWRVVPEQGAPLTAFWMDGDLRDQAGRAVGGTASVTLWHPLHQPDATQVAMLRERLMAAGIVQPFPQAWRAVFHAIDGKVDERFEGFFMEKHVVRAVARSEGWRYDWHPRSPGDVTRNFGALVVRIQLASATYDAEVMRSEGLVLQQGAESFASVEPLAVSEVLRAADRLIGRCRIRTSEDSVIQDALFGPLTSTGRARRDVLAASLDRLALPYPCVVEGRVLRVTGPAGAVEVHLGTCSVRDLQGNACVVTPTKGSIIQAETVFLPFDGDPLLRQVLATVLTWQTLR